jgi:hypothetical protein
MASTINDYLPLVRADLGDPSATIWSDADLRRHLAHAVAEYQLWKPLEALDTAHSLVAGSRTIDLSDVPALMRVQAVEYPTGQWPPAYVPFQLWSKTLTLQLDAPPAAGNPLDVGLYLLLRHTVDGSHCSVDPTDDELITTGAVQFAALEHSFLAAGTVNATGPNSWLHYRDLALDRALEFRAALQAVRARVTPNRLYAPAEPATSRYAVQAPG